MKYLLKYNESLEDIRVSDAKDIIEFEIKYPFSDKDMQFIKHLESNAHKINLKINNKESDFKKGKLTLQSIELEKVMEPIFVVWKFKDFYLKKTSFMTRLYMGAHSEGTPKYKKYFVENIKEVFST